MLRSLTAWAFRRVLAAGGTGHAGSKSILVTSPAPGPDSTCNYRCVLSSRQYAFPCSLLFASHAYQADTMLLVLVLVVHGGPLGSRNSHAYYEPQICRGRGKRPQHCHDIQKSTCQQDIHESVQHLASLCQATVLRLEKKMIVISDLLVIMYLTDGTFA